MTKEQEVTPLQSGAAFPRQPGPSRRLASNKGGAPLLFLGKEGGSQTRRMSSGRWDHAPLDSKKRGWGEGYLDEDSRRHLPRPGMGRGDIAGNGSRLRETGQLLTNQVARERKDGRHAPPSNERASAYAAFGRSGATGPSDGLSLVTRGLYRLEMSLGTE